MDRRYYFAKLFVIAVAVGLTMAGGGFGTARLARAYDDQIRHSAPAQLQDAAWHATGSAVRLVACFAMRTLHRTADIAH